MSAELTLRLFMADMKYRQLDCLEKYAEHEFRHYHKCMLDGVVITTAFFAHGHPPSFANRHELSVVDCDISFFGVLFLYGTASDSLP